MNIILTVIDPDRGHVASVDASVLLNSPAISSRAHFPEGYKSLTGTTPEDDVARLETLRSYLADFVDVVSNGNTD